MEQLHHGLYGEWFLEKRYMISDKSIRLPILFGQARHQDHAKRLLHGQCALDDFVTMDPRIRIFGGGQLKTRSGKEGIYSFLTAKRSFFVGICVSRSARIWNMPGIRCPMA